MKTCPQCSASYPDDYAVCPKDSTRLAGAGSWEPDSIIRGKYKIVAKIGEGGMAAVYRANHLLLDEVRALKVIKADLARDEQFVRRFKNEAINTRKLQHLNAVRVDDLDIAEDGRQFIAMELVEGESLKDRILRSGPLGVSSTVDVALQVSAALEAAHALGLVHRDIKPDNIVLVERTGTAPLVKILDFGIARVKEAATGTTSSGMTLTGTGVVIGTPDYMSPEQAMGKRGDDLDGRSDLYSLGIVMYRMLTGELPFKADTTVEMILHHIRTIPQPPGALKPQLGIPDTVSAIVMRALEKDREKRFPSAVAMAEALRKAQDGLAVTMRAPAPVAGKAPDPRLVKTKPASAPFPEVPAGALADSASPTLPLQPRSLVVLPMRAPSPSLSPAGPSTQTPAKRSEGSRRGILWATLALALVIAWVYSLRRSRTPQTQPTSSPDTPASLVPTNEPDTSSTSSAAPTTPNLSQPSTVEPKSADPSARRKSLTERRTTNSSLSRLDATHTSKPTSEKRPEPASSLPSAGSSSAPGTSRSSPTPSSSASKPKLDPWPSGVTQFSPVPVSSKPTGASEIRSAAPQDPARAAAESTRAAQRQEAQQLNQIADELLNQGDYGKAAQIFRQVLVMAPDNPRAQKGLQKAIDLMAQKGQGSVGQGQRRSGSRRRP